MILVLPKIKIEGQNINSKDVSIYIKTNGVHTDIVVPVVTDYMDWSKIVSFNHTLSKDTTFRFLALGWGDKGFYLETPQWSDLKASVAFKAAFGLSSTAIHATFYHEMIENDSCIRLDLSKEQYQQLTNYIMNSFEKNNENKTVFIPTNAVYGKNDAFYNANGKYSLFHTCNTWSNNSLKVCGQKACLWTPLDKGIFNLYKNN